MKIIVFKNGNTREITGEEGKYWLTGEDRVRKLSGSIAEVRDVAAPEKPKKKAAAKKKKAEAEADGERGE